MAEKSIFLSDNHASHHIPEVEQIISATGAIAMYISPYSTERNPIEGVYSIVKAWIRDNDMMWGNHTWPRGHDCQSILQC